MTLPNQALSPDAEKIAVFRKGMAVIEESWQRW